MITYFALGYGRFVVAIVHVLLLIIIDSWRSFFRYHNRHNSILGRLKSVFYSLQTTDLVIRIFGYLQEETKEIKTTVFQGKTSYHVNSNGCLISINGIGSSIRSGDD